MESNPNYLEGNFRGLQHLGIPVTDLAQTVAFYTRLGFRQIHGNHVDEPDGRVEVAFMEQRGVVIEFYQVTEPEREGIRSRKDGHIDHLAFDVESVERKIAEFSDDGFTMIHQKPKNGADNKKIAFLHPKSTNGVLVEICEDRQS